MRWASWFGASAAWGAVLCEPAMAMGAAVALVRMSSAYSSCQRGD